MVKRDFPSSMPTGGAIDSGGLSVTGDEQTSGNAGA